MAMNFIKGEKYKVISMEGYDWARGYGVNEGVILTYNCGGGFKSPDNSGGNVYLSSVKFEHVKEAYAPKKGDRFRVISAYGSFAKGDVVTYKEREERDLYKHFEKEDGTFEPLHFQDWGWPDEVEPLESGIHRTAALKEIQFCAAETYPIISSSPKKSEEERQVRKKMAEYQIGDRVKNGSSVGTVVCWNPSRKKGVINWDGGTKSIYENCDCCGTSDHFHGAYTDGYGVELVSKANSNMTNSRVKLTPSQKKNLSKDAVALVEAGFYTADLKLYSDAHFRQFLLDKFEAEYAAAAREELAEDDKLKQKDTKKTV